MMMMVMRASTILINAMMVFAPPATCPLQIAAFPTLQLQNHTCTDVSLNQQARTPNTKSTPGTLKDTPHTMPYLSPKHQQLAGGARVYALSRGRLPPNGSVPVKVESVRGLGSRV